MAKIAIAALGKSYGTVEIIRNLNLEFADGEFTVMVGPSGCGKTTLLRSIAGLEEISSGTIHIGDRRVDELPPKDRDIAMVFQNYALYPTMTVAANLGFGLKLRGAAKPEIKDKVANAARILDMEALLDRYPKELSGGQKQRVAMGRAIVRDPQVFLFDEPLSNLDAKLRSSMRTEIKALHQRLGTTIIYVTHDQIEAMTMADRIVVMRSGVVEQIGAPLEIYNYPANRFVAGFIGSPAMNFLDGTIEVSGDKTVLRIDNEHSVTVPERYRKHSGQVATLGVRPEHIKIGNKSSAEVKRCRVAVLEPTGSTTQISVQFGERQLTVQVPDQCELQAGTVLHLTMPEEKVHLFNQTGARI
jgi:multiple sugar transport system ATP-binding protein